LRRTQLVGSSVPRLWRGDNDGIRIRVPFLPNTQQQRTDTVLCRNIGSTPGGMQRTMQQRVERLPTQLGALDIHPGRAVVRRGVRELLGTGDQLCDTGPPGRTECGIRDLVIRPQHMLAWFDTQYFV